MVAAGILALQQSFDVAQAFGFGNLREQQCQQHVLGRQPTDALVGTVLADEPVECGPGKLVYQLTEYSILVRHGGGPSHVRFVGKRFELSRINPVRFVQQKRTGRPCACSGHDR